MAKFKLKDQNGIGDVPFKFYFQKIMRIYVRIFKNVSKFERNI